MFSVKTAQGTPLRLITSSSYFFLQVQVVIKQQWLMLDHGTCSLNNNPKNSGGVKKQQVKKNKNKKTEWNNNKLYGPFYGWFSTASRLEPLYFITLSSQKFLKFFNRVVRTWGGVILMIQTFFKAKKSTLRIMNIN